MTPSAKRLITELEIHPYQAALIRAHIQSVECGEVRLLDALEEIDDVLGTLGVRYLPHKDDNYSLMLGIDYCRRALMHAPTIAYNHSTGKFILMSLSDMIINLPGIRN